ncbi:hypothetical protein FACS1894185_6130 [Betaproteobacteria bacterium]|nr:hypothetical protein AGMMS49545_09680 [Betaproteobacteria bacterium]GHU12019.1 hypothetical protein FACS1894185_6130 [Betaproteobacteria bacterium]GHU44456.1 hypothetical protein AGMMS50289_12800 [Betaproteobacteria bacterium]
MTASTQQDPMDFFRQLWGGMGFKMPGMVAPTFDPNDLEKQITDLKAVEGWLRMNISMLQMTIQGLEMQHSTLSTVKSFSETIRSSSGNPADDAASDAPSIGDALQRATLWPWEVIQQVQEGVQKHLEEEVERAESTAAAVAKSAPKPAAKATAKKAAPKSAGAAKKPAR